MGVLLSILIHIPLSAVEIFGGKRIASLMVTDPPVLELCRQYLLIVGIFVFFLGFLMVFRNCIQGMGNTWIPMLSGGLEVFSRLIFGYWLGRHSYGDCRCRSLCMDQRQHYARKLIFYFVSESSPDTNTGKHNRYKEHKNGFIK